MNRALEQPIHLSNDQFLRLNHLLLTDGQLQDKSLQLRTKGPPMHL